MNSKMDLLLGMMKESKKEKEMRDKSYDTLSRQVGQLAEEVAQLKGSGGKFPSDTTVNPK